MAVSSVTIGDYEHKRWGTKLIKLLIIRKVFFVRKSFFFKNLVGALYLSGYADGFPNIIVEVQNHSFLFQNIL